MAEQQKLSLCPRLVDYLAIVGARTTPPIHKGLPGNKTPPVQVSKQSTRTMKPHGRHTEELQCYVGLAKLQYLITF